MVSYLMVLVESEASDIMLSSLLLSRASLMQPTMPDFTTSPSPISGGDGVSEVRIPIVSFVSLKMFTSCNNFAEEFKTNLEQPLQD